MRSLITDTPLSLLSLRILSIQFMGIAIGSGVVPIALLVNWKGISAKAAICGAFGGQALAVMAWLVTCSSLYTDITVDTLGMNYPM